MTSNYSQWKAWFDNAAKAELKSSYNIQQEAAQMLFDKIVERTPVGDPSTWNTPYWPKGYVPGYLKGNWKIEYSDKTVTISNDAAYAEAVENGWSKQAPAGMMKISTLEWDKLLEIASRRNRK